MSTSIHELLVLATRKCMIYRNWRLDIPTTFFILRCVYCI